MNSLKCCPEEAYLIRWVRRRQINETKVITSRKTSIVWNQSCCKCSMNLCSIQDSAILVAVITVAR